MASSRTAERSAGPASERRRGALRVLRSPKWMAAHVVALVAVVLFVNLGFWQLRRLDERRAHNALLTERLDADPVALDGLSGDEGELAYRRVVVEGVYRPGEEVLLSTRSRQGQPGHHLLTPLETAAGVVVIDRGWIPLEWGETLPVDRAAPPEGEVRVEGIAYPSQQTSRAGSLDGQDADLEFVSQVDLARLGQVVDGTLYPLYVLALEQQPEQPGTFPDPAEPAPLTEANHASYAGQWFLFALVVTLGYPFLLRRIVREQRADDKQETVTYDGKLGVRGRGSSTEVQETVAHDGKLGVSAWEGEGRGGA